MNEDEYILERIKSDTIAGQTLLDTYCGKRLKNLINNISDLNEHQVNQYLNCFYISIINQLDYYNIKVHLAIYIEYILRKKLLSDIKNNVFYKEIILSDIANIYINSKCEKQHKPNNFDKILLKMNSKLFVFLLDRYYYLKDIDILEKKYGISNVIKFEEMIKKHFNGLYDIKIIEFLQNISFEVLIRIGKYQKRNKVPNYWGLSLEKIIIIRYTIEIAILIIFFIIFYFYEMNKI